ncbi:RadC family protein [Rhizosaccharibacter radicis]|uniref:DNA repair protein RadC n=1 Tax=Rhizosaccharibacter radicis TaxID=2782605 RepID=A0ABT1VWE3_9PROT|nr:DNA repair protein RadC [Acetobacteraceae bacterium KSS12]
MAGTMQPMAPADGMAEIAGLPPGRTAPPDLLADLLSTRALPPQPTLPDAAGADHADATDAVLLCRLLRMAMPQHADVASLADNALSRFGSFAAVLAAPVRELRGIAGFGMHSVSALKLMHEAAIRLSGARLRDRPLLDEPDRLMGYLSAVLARERIEQFRILFLDGDDRLLADEAQARGTVNHTPVYPREVARRAMELEAASLVLVHNHPSGDPTPSREDLAMTKQVASALEVIGVQVRDHIIVGNGRWTSFRKEKLLA